MAKRPDQGSSRIRLKSSGPISCRNEKTMLIQLSQLERYVEDIYDHITTSSTPKWIHISFTGSLSVCTFCFSPLITSDPTQLRAPFPIQSTTLHTCLLMLTILSGLFAIGFGFCILVKYYKHRTKASREEIRKWAADYALQQFKDEPELIGESPTFIPLYSEDTIDETSDSGQDG